MLRHVHFALLAGPLALLTGCGSTYSKADFVARADAICARALRDTRSIPPPGGRQLGSLAAYAGQVLEVQRREQAELRALPVPGQSASQSARLRNFLAAERRVETNYAALAGAARRRDAAGVTSAEAALRSVPISALAARYGLRTCAGPGATVR